MICFKANIPIQQSDPIKATAFFNSIYEIYHLSVYLYHHLSVWADTLKTHFLLQLDWPRFGCPLEFHLCGSCYSWTPWNWYQMFCVFIWMNFFNPKGGSWLVLGRGREEECGNEVPCRGRGLGAGWQNGFERGATGLTVVQQTWLVAVCNCKKS